MPVDDQTSDAWPAPIVITLRADAGHIRLVRLLASGVGSSLGLPVDDIEDLRVTVDEVCTTLVETTEDETITLEFALTDDSLVIEGHATRGAPVDEARLAMTRRILDVIADEEQMISDNGTMRFRVARRLSGPAAR
jgi:serine/threonine-protein kinase RsbW